jgi:hypothetical protein
MLAPGSYFTVLIPPQTPEKTISLVLLMHRRDVQLATGVIIWRQEDTRLP